MIVSHQMPAALGRIDVELIATFCSGIKVANALDVLAQVVPSRLLLTSRPRHRVIALLRRHADDALQGERGPGFGVGDEGGGGVMVRDAVPEFYDYQSVLRSLRDAIGAGLYRPG